MKGLSKEVKSAIIIGVVIVLLLILGIIYGQKEKTEVNSSAVTTTVAAVEEETTTAAAVEETTTVTVSAQTTTTSEIRVPDGAVVAKNSEGKWALLKDNEVVTGYTGIAKNDYGTWYVENGYVNFDFTGKVVFNNVTYDIENGKVA